MTTTTTAELSFPYPHAMGIGADPAQTGPAADPRALGASTRRRERGWLGALLAATAVLYLWGLGASGYANDFYAAAVQAGTTSWKAFFFGSLDSSNFITVDKPPLSLWPMEISGRLFGFSSWSMLVPQALEGVLAVWLLYATVRRWFGPRAGLLAGALLAITPVAVLMFRFNNPDALMTLLIVVAAYCVTRAIEAASTRWLLIASTVMGLSFLAKGLQPFTVLPALALAYLVAAPTRLRTRVWQLLAAGFALLAAAGWWVLAVSLVPAADRPYIGGSGNNTVLGLAFGYNGLSRITGDTGGANFSGTTGIGRLFNSLNGGQIAWLLPTALLGISALAVLTRHLPRTDRTRAALILWGGWLLVTAGVLSFASGVIHTYYTVEIAPAIAALVAVATVVLWRQHDQLAARWTLAGGMLLTGVWSYTLLHRASTWYPWIADVVLVASVLSALAIAMLLPGGRTARRIATAATVFGLIALGGGSAAYAVDTAATPHTGSVPSAGPPVASAGFGGPGGGLGRGAGRPGAARAGRSGPPAGAGPGFGAGAEGALGSGGAASGLGQGGPPGSSSGNAGSAGDGASGSGSSGTGASGIGSAGNAGAGGAGGGLGAGPGGATTSVGSALVAALRATSTRWAAATIGSQSAAPLELASGTAVMAIGGFSGTDDAPTLAQFEQDVANGEIRYFIAEGQGAGPGGPGGGQASSSAITSWVQAHYSATSIGGVTVYDLSKPVS